MGWARFLATVTLALALPVASVAQQRPSAPAPAADALAPEPSTYVAGPRTDTLIAGATILDGDGRRLVGDVLIRAGRIVAVGPNLAHPAGVTLVDGAGRWLTPGLIDIHTHDGTYLLPQATDNAADSDVTEGSDPNVADTWIEHAVRPEDPAFGYALAGGVTTLQILPGSDALISGRSVIVHPVPAVTVDQMRFPGAAQGLKMACGNSPADTFGARHIAPTSRQGEIAQLRRAFLEAQHYEAERREFRDHAEHGPPGHHGPPDGRHRPGGEHDGPSRDLRMDTLVAAMHGELPVHIHCYRADDILTWIHALAQFGVHVAAVHHAVEAYKIAPELVRAGVCVVTWADWWGFKREAEDGIPENAAFVDAAGGCVTMHSDIPVLGSLLNIEAAKAAAAGRRAGLDIPPERAIRWITSNPARAMGLGDRIGRIAPGLDGDLVLWSGDPFSIYSHPDMVWIDGAVRYDRRVGRRESDAELGRPEREMRP